MKRSRFMKRAYWGFLSSLALMFAMMVGCSLGNGQVDKGTPNAKTVLTKAAVERKLLGRWNMDVEPLKKLLIDDLAVQVEQQSDGALSADQAKEMLMNTLLDVPMEALNTPLEGSALEDTSEVMSMVSQVLLAQAESLLSQLEFVFEFTSEGKLIQTQNGKVQEEEVWEITRVDPGKIIMRVEPEMVYEVIFGDDDTLELRPLEEGKMLESIPSYRFRRIVNAKDKS